jgi:gliding motility-associated-like protein
LRSGQIHPKSDAQPVSLFLLANISGIKACTLILIMPNKTALALAHIALILSSCNLSDNDYLACPSNTTAVRQTVNGKGFIIPNAFTPNGDGLNDVFALVHNQYTKSIFIQVKDASGNIINTDTSRFSRSTRWDGNHAIDKTPYPSAKYRVDYKIVLDDSTADGASYEGHTCVSLLRNSTDKKCVIPLEDWHNYVLEDMVDIPNLSTPYNSGENFCQ